jgi:hypothetical protein
MKYVIAICLICLGQKVFAQPFTLDPAIKPIELKLHKFNPAKEPKAKGKLNVTDVNQVKDTMYFFAKGVSIYSPIYVGVSALDETSPVEVSLHKMNWKEAERTGSTNEKGQWKEQFKTENDFGIRVIANKKPATYSLIVWTGDEPKMELPAVFKKKGDKSGDVKVAGASSNFFKENLLYIIIGVLAVAIIFLLIKRKAKSHEANLS